MHYAYNPIKNMIMGFKDKEIRNTYLDLDPKQFGDLNDRQQRRPISIEEKENLIEKKNSGFAVMSDEYIKLIDKLSKKTIEDDYENLRFKKQGYNSVGIVIQMTNQQIKELKEKNPEIFEKYAIVLDKNEKDQEKVINIAKINGNFIPYQKNFDAEKFYSKVAFAMHPKNFSKLNPDYNKFALLMSKDKKNPQIFRFPSSTKRQKFIDDINQSAKSNEDVKASSISSFNAITTLKCHLGQIVDMHKKSINSNDLKNIISAHVESTQFKKERQNRQLEKTNIQTTQKTEVQKHTKTR